MGLFSLFLIQGMYMAISSWFLTKGNGEVHGAIFLLSHSGQWRGTWGFLLGLSLRVMERYMGLSSWSLTKGNGEVHGAVFLVSE